MENFEIKMLKQEYIKGPLPKTVGTAGSAVKFDFFFTFPSQSGTPQAPTTPVLQNQKS